MVLPVANDQLDEVEAAAHYANGMAEAVIELPFSSPEPVLAVGAELKNTICVIEGDTATVDAGVGALTRAAAYRRFRQRVDKIRASFASKPYVIAHDHHPAYLSTQYALACGARRDSRTCGGRCVGVQHHHAHIVACMAENGFTDPAIGICCDGAGYGSDGASWGGEVLHVSMTRFERSAHLQYLPLPGGDAAAGETWRPALSLVHESFGGDLPDEVRELFHGVDQDHLAIVEGMLRADFNCPKTSSLGRLFDAVAFLAGLCDRNDTQGQAAMRLERAATLGRAEPYPFRIEEEGGGASRIVCEEMTAAICDDISRGEAQELIASRFHETVATMLSDAAARAGGMAKRSAAMPYEHVVDVAVLSGGCFLNRLLTRRIKELLLERGFRRVLTHTRLSPGDASLSLGQAVVAAARSREGSQCA